MQQATNRQSAPGILWLALLCWLSFGICSAQEEPVVPYTMQPLPGAEGVRVEQKLGEKISLDTPFTNAEGEKVTLRHYFDRGQPVALTVVYYRCPMLCGLTLTALVDGLKGLDWHPGENFQVLTVSMDPRETAEMAKAQKNSYLSQLEKPEAAQGWDFMVGEQESITKLTEELGFHYNFIEKTGEYAHESALFLLTADGRIARVLPGTSFESQSLKLGLLEAGEGKIGSFLDTIFLKCYHYDPASGSYRFAMGAMRIGGLITMLLLFGPIAFFVWRERRSARNKAMGQAAPVHTTASLP